MKEEYKRISCNLYDELEHYATFKKRLRVRYKVNEEQEQEEEMIIVNFKTTKEAEYLINSEGMAIRLDHLLLVEEIE